MAQEKIFADDTTLPVLDPGRGRTKTGRLWCYAVDDRPWGGPAPPAVAFVYATDRKGERPAAHLSSFRGILQVDGYAGFGKVVKARDDDALALAFCWTHARRGFYEFHQATQSPIAAEALARIPLGRKNALFAGNDSGAEHWALMATLIGSAKLSGIEPLAWLTNVLESIVAGTTRAHEIDRLLPWAWKTQAALPATA